MGFRDITRKANLAKRECAAVEVERVVVRGVAGERDAPCREKAAVQVDRLVVPRLTNEDLRRSKELRFSVEREGGLPAVVTKHD